MPSLTHASIPLKLAGAVLALALIAAVAVAVTLTAGPTQAQSTDNAYAPPRCGPGFDDFYEVPEFPADQVNSGHLALFDAYYDFDADEPHRPTQEGEPWAGLMSLNFCPPQLEQSTSGRPPATVTTRHATDINIDRTVFHVDEVHTLTAADVAAYPFFEKGDADDDGVDDAVGQQVYWLRAGGAEDGSDFQISFSTALFDARYWHREDDEGNSVAPLWYEIEAERELGVHPREFGHIYVFDDSPVSGQERKEAIWNSEHTDTGRFDMEPGQYRSLQWAFTKEGTYELEVHLNGHTRQVRPDNLPEGEVWHPVSEHEIVSTDVKRYIIQVGPLTLNEQPMFRAPDSTIPENSAAGTLVGSPVPVRQADSDPLTYELTGNGHGNFEVESVAQGGQIKVAAGAHLDYESVRAYDLVMHVRDGKNRESGPDAEVDSSIAVRIALSDVEDGNPPSVSLSVSPTTQDRNGTVTFTGAVTDLPHAAFNVTYAVWVLGSDGNPSYERESGTSLTPTVRGLGSARTASYQMEVEYDLPNHLGLSVFSNTVTVVWE